ncbi:MAG: hypothetical protein H7Y18_03310 [Clostridiaceae bacterium]|nr:hypothetical protein [Clostridiaceae bacterium]
MSLIETNVFKISKIQYAFKLKANFGIFFILAIVQMASIFFSTGTVSSISTNHITIFGISGNIVIIFTIIWGISNAFILTGKNCTDMDFTFISNRLSSNLSNVAILLTAALVGSITTSLSVTVLRLFYYFKVGSKFIIGENFNIPPKTLLLSIISLLFYLILIMSISYLFGILLLLNPVLKIILPIVTVGLLVLQGLSPISNDFFNKIITFYTLENSLLLFGVKALLTAIIFFSGAVILSNRMGVRK